MIYLKKQLLIFYYVLLTYFLLKPSGDSIPPFEYFDKVVHLSIFMLLGVILKLSYQIKGNLIIGVILYAVTTEILQHYMRLGRSFDMFDIIANLIGFYLGTKLAGLSKRH